MISLSVVIVVIVVYVLFLFAIASYGEKVSGNRKNILNNPVIYSLSLAVYCTSWTFYGSVGAAANYGMLFLAIYLGPTLSTIVWWNVLRKLVRLKNKMNTTSMVDLISARHDKSEMLGFLCTVFIVVGIIPYIALQLKAIIKTIHIISDNSALQASVHAPNVDLVVIVLMILCTIVFGIRKLNISERHPGMVLVLAFESIVKLVAFLAVGLVATYSYNNGINDILDKIPQIAEFDFNILGTGNKAIDALNWITYLVLAFGAILFLPRGFHIAVIENNNEEHIKMAKWMFPFYLLLINIFVLPIAITGRMAGIDIAESDYYVLLLAQLKNYKIFTLMIFIGGFSAAAGMIMIETVAISTMVSNNIFLPVFTRVKALTPLSRQLLKLRWIAAAMIIFAAYLFMSIVEDKNLLSIGLIAFVAALQFAPLVLGALYWKKGSKVGAYMGISTGALLWFYTLVIPSFARSGFFSDRILKDGLLGIEYLRPEMLFGLNDLPYLSHAIIWSLIFNIVSYALFSLLFPPSESEQKIAEEFVNILPQENFDEFSDLGARETVELEPKKIRLLQTLELFCSDFEAKKILNQALLKSQISDKEKISILKLAELYREIEKNLAGIIGTAASFNALKKAMIISSEENESLTLVYSRLLANMKINPAELKKQISLYQEKEKLMKYETKLMQDVLEKKSAELEEQKSLAFQASKMAALGEMAAGIAHEINNPLSIIKLNNHLMQKVAEKDISDKESILKYCHNIDNTITRISKIIMGLMAISRNDRYEEYTYNKLKDILDDVLPFCMEKFKIHGVEIKINLDDDVYQTQVKCSRVQLSQVLLNLFNNAYDAVIDLPERWIKIEAKTQSGNIYICITDSGHGIPKNIQERIFQPFFTTKEVGKGTGLGLSLSSAILANHKGYLTLDSKSEHTTFVICLPLQ